MSAATAAARAEAAQLEIAQPAGSIILESGNPKSEAADANGNGEEEDEFVVEAVLEEKQEKTMNAPSAASGFFRVLLAVALLPAALLAAITCCRARMR